MKIRTITAASKQATHDLIFSHMSDVELASFKANNSTAYAQIIDILNGERGVCLVAEENKFIVGYLLAENKTDNSSSIKYAELREMRVRKDYQRKGIGSQLVEGFMQWAKDEGYERLSVDVYALSEINVGFYQKFGFVSKTLTMERRID